MKPLRLWHLLPISLMFALLWCSAAALAETRPRYGGTVVGGLLGEPVHIDPVMAQSHADITVVSLLFDTLYRVDGKDPGGRLRIAPHLATDLPTADESGTQVRIPLRADVTFHDGTPVRPTDIVQSLQRTAQSSQAGHLLASVKAIDHRDQELVLSLTRATPELAVLLAAPATAITPGGRAPTWKRATGSGAFRLASKKRAQHRLILAVNNEYFAGRPYVNKLDLRWFDRPDDEATAYESGASHFSLRDAVAYAGHTPKYATREASGLATILAYVGFGPASTHGRVVADRDFRQALSLAIERGGFLSIGSGERVTPTLEPVASALGGTLIQPAQARARLSEARSALERAASAVPALKARSDRGVRDFELELIVDRSRPDDQAIAAKVVAALFQLGLRARIATLEAPVFAERVAAGNCDLYIGQLALPSAHADASLAATFAIDGDDWSTRALRKAPLDRAAAGKAFSAQLPIVPLFHRALRVHHRSNLRGVAFDDASLLTLGDLFFYGRLQRSR